MYYKMEVIYPPCIHYPELFPESHSQHSYFLEQLLHIALLLDDTRQYNPIKLHLPRTHSLRIVHQQGKHLKMKGKVVLRRQFI